MTELQVKAKKGSLKKFFAMFLAVCVCMTTINVNAGLVTDEKTGTPSITLGTETMELEVGGASKTLTVNAKRTDTSTSWYVSGDEAAEVTMQDGKYVPVATADAGKPVVSKSNANTIPVTDYSYTVTGTGKVDVTKVTGGYSVQGRVAGNVTITVKAGDVEKTCTVKVKPATVHATKVTITPNPLNLQLGKTTTGQLTAKVEPTGAVENTVTWKSDNEKVAKVDSKGLVTAVAEGTTTITAITSNGAKGTCTVKVAAADKADNTVSATKVALNAKNVYIPAGKSFTVKAKVTPKNSTDTVTWKSAKTSVAKVSEGKITAQKKAAGKSTTVTATAGKKSAKVTVYVVKSAKAAALADASVTAGKKVTLKFTGLNAATSSVKWSSSNNKIATVSNGVVTGKKQGVVTITAKIGKKSVKCVVAVSKKGTSLTLKKTSATVKVGKTTKIAKKKIGKKDSIKSYKSSNTKVATVTKKGVVKGKKKGSAVITVQTKKGAYATFRVTVKK